MRCREARPGAGLKRRRHLEAQETQIAARNGELSERVYEKILQDPEFYREFM